MDNETRTMAWFPLEPYGFAVTYINDGEKLPDGATLIQPPAIERPKFDAESQSWTTAPKDIPEPTPEQQILMQESATMTQMQQLIMSLSQEVAQLKGAN